MTVEKRLSGRILELSRRPDKALRSYHACATRCERELMRSEYFTIGAQFALEHLRHEVKATELALGTPPLCGERRSKVWLQVY